MGPILTIDQAQSNFTAAAGNLRNADHAQSTAADGVTSAQKQLDAATATKEQADADDNAAVGAYDQAVDDLVAALQATKRPVSGTPSA